jgi:hypothetical protein
MSDCNFGRRCSRRPSAVSAKHDKNSALEAGFLTCSGIAKNLQLARYRTIRKVYGGIRYLLKITTSRRNPEKAAIPVFIGKSLAPNLRLIFVSWRLGAFALSQLPIFLIVGCCWLLLVVRSVVKKQAGSTEHFAANFAILRVCITEVSAAVRALERCISAAIDNAARRSMQIGSDLLANVCAVCLRTRRNTNSVEVVNQQDFGG